MDTNKKPFGWAVKVEFCDKLVYVPGYSGNTVKTFHYRGSRGQAAMRGKLKPHAWAVLSVEPVTEEQWRRALGNPEERGL